MKSARDILSLLRLDDGRKWIEAALPFQLEDAIAILEGSVPYCFLTRSRGSSKTTDLAAVMLALLLTAQDRFRAYWLASDGDQGSLALDVIAGFVSRTPGLADRVEIQSRRVVVKIRARCSRCWLLTRRPAGDSTLMRCFATSLLTGVTQRRRAGFGRRCRPLALSGGMRVWLC